MLPNIYKLLCVIVGLIISTIGLMLGFYVFPKLIDQNIDKSVKLINGSDAYKRWETLPIPLQFKVYFFNVTNPDEVQLGAKPKVDEIGPYVYDQLRHKYDINIDNDTLSYYQNQIFTFNEQASKPNREDDIVTVVHLPLMVISTMAESRLPQLVNKIIPTLFYEPKNVFITTTIKEFLFDGIYVACDKKNKSDQGILTQFKGNQRILKMVCNEIKKSAPVQLEELTDGRFKFSLLSYKNNTHDGHYQTNSGVKNIDLLGQILAWKDSSILNTWKSNSTCNNIYGTDTTIFAPHQTPESKIKVFQSDVCRSINLHYNRKITYQGIAGLRYTVEKDMLASSTNFSANDCFCLKKTKGITGKDGCLLDGAMELWNCQNVPAILTFPHFYLANEVYKNTVIGLHPNRSLHETFVDLEPKSGVVLRGSKRVQFNIFYRKINGIDITQNLSDSLMPIVWIDEGVELNEKNINLIKDTLFYPIKIMKGVYWTLTALGLSIGLIGIVWWIVFKHKPKKLF